MIACEGLLVEQGEFTLGPVDFQLPDGAYAVAMGPTGCGKTTMIEAIAGLRPVTAGRILCGGVDITHLDPARRSLGYVPQDGAMFPNFTVAEQLAFGLELRKGGDLTKTVITQRVKDLADLLHIPHLLDRQPQGLSGGERQRVALGRALAIEPAMLLLDEPLAALDEDKRAGMCDLLDQVHEEFGMTVLHITHSRSEAERLASHHLRFSQGKLIDLHVVEEEA
jgi:ABC-type sugar transport system ATPase subunit